MKINRALQELQTGEMGNIEDLKEKLGRKNDDDLSLGEQAKIWQEVDKQVNQKQPSQKSWSLFRPSSWPIWSLRSKAQVEMQEEPLWPAKNQKSSSRSYFSSPYMEAQPAQANESIYAQADDLIRPQLREIADAFFKPNEANVEVELNPQGVTLTVMQHGSNSSLYSPTLDQLEQLKSMVDSFPNNLSDDQRSQILDQVDLAIDHMRQLEAGDEKTLTSISRTHM